MVNAVEINPVELVPLGRSGLQITPLGMGTWAWGDRLFWGYGGDYHDGHLREAFRVSLEGGINFFDTAEIYGFGISETLLGEFIRGSNANVVVATKFMPFPWRLRRQSVVEALHKSLSRLGLKRVDLLQIHVPLPPVPIETWMSGLADAVEAGMTRAVGVSNYSVQQTKRAQAALARRGIPLASNQVEYSLLHRAPERNGLLQFCREENITLIAYSPIRKAVLTGKYTPQATPPGARGLTYHSGYMSRVQPLIDLLRQIGKDHGKSATQVALNWVLCKGAVAIPGVKNEAQASENLGALGWRLSAREAERLDETSALVAG